MEKIVPVISSSTEGPLGIKHLPRIWMKTLLGAIGRLAADYKDIRPGFDYIALEGLGVNPDSAREFIYTNRPTYLAFEQWIREQPGVNLSRENIAKINEIIVSKEKDPEVRKQILRESNLPENTPITDAVMLNNLDDWKLAHDSLTK